MIFFLCLRRNAVPIVQYLRTIWPDKFGARIEPVCYEDLARLKIRRGLYVFSDIELLDDVRRAEAMALHARLLAEPGRYRVWNDPARSARRFDVLDAMAREGINRFRAFRADEALPADVRYPVFVRDEHEHKGALTPLLADEAAVRAAIAELRAGSRPTGPLLVVEYLEYESADGIYRKYSVFRLGDRLLAKHVLFSPDWLLRTPDVKRFAGPKWLEEEWRFLRDDAAHEALRGVFERLHIDYGRIDYTLVDGRVQVFEINSNPMLLKPSQFRPDGPRLEIHRWFADRFAEMMTAADPVRRVPFLRRIWWRLHKPKSDPTPWWRRLLPGWKPATPNVAQPGAKVGAAL